MMDKCRVVFVCVFYVLMWCVVAAVAADMSLTQTAVRDNFKKSAEEKYFNRRMVDFYETFIEGAVDVSDYSFMAWRIYKLENCNLNGDIKATVNEELNNLHVLIKSTRQVVETGLRPMAAGNKDRETIQKMRETVNKKESATPDFLIAVKNMTVPLTEVKKAIPAINASIEKIDQKIEIIENLLQSENTGGDCSKKGVAKEWLKLSRNVLTKIQTAAENAEKWQEEFFTEQTQAEGGHENKLKSVGKNQSKEPQQGEGEKKDVPQQTEEKIKDESQQAEKDAHNDKMQQERMSVPGEEKNSTNESLSFDGSVTLGVQDAVVFVFFTVSVVIPVM